MKRERLASHFWSRSLMVEQRPFKSLVVGSTPTGTTNWCDECLAIHPFTGLAIITFQQLQWIGTIVSPFA